MDSIDRKLYSEIDGITTFEWVARVGMSWSDAQVYDEEIVFDMQR